MKWFFTLMLLGFSFSTFALSTNDLALKFYKNKISETNQSLITGNDECNPRPDAGSCAKSICGKLPAYMCDSSDEILQVTNMCKGNFGGECVAKVFTKLPPYQYDSLDEMNEIATACRNVHGSQCFDLFAAKLPSYKLDSKDEIFEVLDHCRNASRDVVDCAVFTCSKLQPYQCDDTSELYDILKSCGN